jgi:hypothetical protein
MKSPRLEVFVVVCILIAHSPSLMGQNVSRGEHNVEKIESGNGELQPGAIADKIAPIQSLPEIPPRSALLDTLFNVSFISSRLPGRQVVMKANHEVYELRACSSTRFDQRKSSAFHEICTLRGTRGNSFRTRVN